MSRRPQEGGDICAIFIHAGAGYHSHQNERIHLSAVNDAAKVGMAVLKSGGDATDAVEMAVRLLEDKEITNAGYGSNLTMDGHVECDATIVDHFGRSGAVGALRQVKNPIGVARLVLEESNKPLSLQRVPPNLLVGPGATDYAATKGVPILPPDLLISASARERWLRWRQDLESAAEREASNQKLPQSPISDPRAGEIPAAMRTNLNKTPITPYQSPPEREKRPSISQLPPLTRPLVISASDMPTLSTVKDSQTREMSPIKNSLTPFQSKQFNTASNGPTEHSESAIDDSLQWSIPAPKRQKLNGSFDGSNQAHPEGDDEEHFSSSGECAKGMTVEDDGEDYITDTVGAIAVDCFGRIAAASSSGGIGMKHMGRCGPAALVGTGTAVIPIEENDPNQTCVATVTSGTGEHMATTTAAATAAGRIYASVKKENGRLVECNEDEAMYSMIQQDFMEHPGVRHSHCTGAIGILAVKKCRDGIYFYFGHNTDSFALASMHSEERKPVCTMSRSKGHGSIAQGGRVSRAKHARFR
ncbi:hypothetical protein PV10_05090 [Exophiala mesophila]|uniref:Uncharacterized protein n=1 Tax=Exophiala mesophila TaxID=212818 RepID=A0A0D1Y093_EXOME|nr:uncharacterized protein PV10_05090 [Exophiala mesophila]KIV93916.1 hypothetical protein PV10_05090 [Exophiala mesophila]